MIYTKNPRQPHVETVCWVLDQHRKYFLFANLKECQFHQDEIYFLRYVVLSKKISMKADRIKIMKDWPEPKSVRNIQVFLGFANCYCQFIQGFNKIAASLILLLKITRLPNEPASSRNDGSRPTSSRNDGSRPTSSRNDGSRPVSNRNNSNMLASGRNNGNIEVDGFDGDGVGHARKSGKLKKLSKSRKLSKSGKSKGEKLKKPLKSGNSSNFDITEVRPSFLTPGTREAFNCLRLAFTKAPILWHFNLKCHIWIETNELSYAISSMLS